MNANSEELYLEAEADIIEQPIMQKLSRNTKAFFMRNLTALRLITPWVGCIKRSLTTGAVKAERVFSDRQSNAILYYLHSYFHIAALLMDMERFDELNGHLKRCLSG